MCPFTQRDLISSHRKLSTCVKDDGQVLLDIRQDFGVTAEELCELMQLRRTQLRDKIEKDYGSSTGLCVQLRTSPTEGIIDDTQQRGLVFGQNVIPLKRSKSFLQLMLQALKEPTLIILEVAAIVSLALSVWNVFRPGAQHASASFEWIEGVAIAIGVLVIVIVSAVNDYGKEQQFRALQNRVREEHKISVIRHGVVAPIPVQDLVVGDICVIKYGDVVPADGIVLQSHELRVDESSLTGESDPVRKDQENDCQMLSGTHVIEGSGRLLILAVGFNSQTGAIYKLLGAVKEEKSKTIKKQKITTNGTSDGTVSDENSLKGSCDIPLGDPALVKKTKDTERKLKNHSVFQSKLNKLAYRIGIVGFIFASATSLVIIIRFCIENYGVLGLEWKSDDATTILDSIIVGITILVAAIPEGLPLAVTLTLAFSAKKMIQDNNLVRHLFACETMGCATTICSDKTGTLTTNRMTVTEAWFGEAVHRPLPSKSVVDHNFVDLLCSAIAINSSFSSNIVLSDLCGLPEQHGNKTECALLQCLRCFDRSYKSIRDMNPEHGFSKVYTFNSLRKSMSTVIPIPGGWRVFCKGAAEIVLTKCDYLMNEKGDISSLSADEKCSVTNDVISEMASNSLRTICVAYKDILTAKGGSINAEVIGDAPNFDNEHAVVSGLTCLGVFGIEDPVRPEVPRAIRRCQRAGITVRMVTGDNLKTARAIAQKCGIIHPGDDSLVLEGEQFNAQIRDQSGEVVQERLDRIWPKLKVLARSTPQDKFTLVQGIIESRISKHREVVAVTGDGTNDAPALKKADVGFAMGIAGTDVAKEASDIILTDDNFISIVKACMWGRNIYDNVSKFLQFQLTVNVAALSVAIVSACIIGDTPLKAVPMLWINMIQDTLGSLALATESPGEALLKRKPYGRKKQIVSNIMIRNILGQGLYQTVILLIMLFAGTNWFDIHEVRQIGHVTGEPSVLYTFIFNSLVIMTSFNLINARCIHNEFNVFHGIFRNPYFLILWTVMLATQVLVVEFGGSAFSAQPLSLEMWMISFAVGVGSLLWYHLLRLIPTKRKRQPKPRPHTL